MEPMRLAGAAMKKPLRPYAKPQREVNVPCPGNGGKDVITGFQVRNDGQNESF